MPPIRRTPTNVPPPPTRTSPAARPAPAAALAAALSDKKLTNAEWKELKPHLQGPAGDRATLDLVVAYGSRTVTLGDEAKVEAGALLEAKGYELRDGMTEVQLKQAIEGNASAPDAAFEGLSQKLSRTAATIRLAVIDGGFAAHDGLRDNLSDARATRATNGKAIGKTFGTFTAAEREAGALHGTHVAGIATRGTAQIRASLYAIPLAVDDVERPKPRTNPLLSALKAAAEGGAEVINLSVEMFPSAAEARAIEALMAKHPSVLFVLGAGNDSYTLGSSPVDQRTLAESFKAPNLVVVGASLPDGGRWGQSNIGVDVVGLAARGHAIGSTDSDGDGLRVESGTSMAAPNVSNLASKCRLLFPGLTPQNTVKLLAATSDPHWTWKGQSASGGTVNAERAMTAAAALALMKKDSLSAEQALSRLEVPTAGREHLKAAMASLA